MASRYEGRPFVRMVELFIIDALGLLTDAERSTLEATSERFGVAMKSSAPTWQGIVLDVLDLPAEVFTSALLEDWKQFDCEGHSGRACAEAYAQYVTSDLVS